MLPALERTDATVDVVHVSDPEVEASVTVRGLRFEGEPRLVAVVDHPSVRALIRAARSDGRSVEVVEVPLTAETAYLHAFGGWVLADEECSRCTSKATRFRVGPLSGPAEARARRLREVDEIGYAYIRAGVKSVRNGGAGDKYEAIERLRWPSPAQGLWILLTRLTDGTLDEVDVAPDLLSEDADSDSADGA